MNARKQLGFWITLLALQMALPAGEIAARKMLWAHNTPWFQPQDSSVLAEVAYNYPLEEVVDTPAAATGSYRLSVLHALHSGVDGFFLDFGADANRGPAQWSWALPVYLKAAEGTDFQVGICLDGKVDAAYWVAELTRLLKANGNHPNYPRYQGKYVVCTYVFNQPFAGWTPQDWRQIRAQLKAAGLEIFLIANLAPLPWCSLQQNELDAWKDTYDCAYMFDSPNHANEPPEINDRLLGQFCRQNGKLFMPTLHPGYWGPWLFPGGNDFYNGYRGLDLFHRTFTAALAARPQWVHLTTWNDLCETAVQERLFTFGQAKLLKVYSDCLKGQENVSESPRVLTAYLREALPGELWRIEAMLLPSQAARVTISGVLRDWQGKIVHQLAPQAFPARDFGRVEWLVPTGELAASPCLTPEFTVSWADQHRTVATPSLMLVTPWLQNAVTVNVPLEQMLPDFPNTLAVHQSGERLTATVTFDAPVPFKRIELFRNDRPVALFSPDLKSDELLLPLSLGDYRDKLDVKINHGRILRAVKKGQHRGDGSFNWEADHLFAWGASGGNGLTVAGSPELSLTLTPAQDPPFTITAAELIRKQCYTASTITIAVTPDKTTLNDTPPGLAKGALTLSFFARAPRPGDSYWVRYETMDGKYHFTSPVYPFAPADGVTCDTAILATASTLETGSAWCLRQESEFLTPERQLPLQHNQIIRCAVSRLSARETLWHFDGDGIDAWGDRHLQIPGDFFAEGGFDGKGQALAFDGQRTVRLPQRLWPLSGFGSMSFWLKPAAGAQKPQAILCKQDGWYDGLSVNLLADGHLEVLRGYLEDYRKPDSLRRQTLTSAQPLAPGCWHHVQTVGDSAQLRLFVDGRLEGAMSLSPCRSQGSGAVILGGGRPGYDNFHGELDELCLQGLP